VKIQLTSPILTSLTNVDANVITRQSAGTEQSLVYIRNSSADDVAES